MKPLARSLVVVALAAASSTAALAGDRHWDRHRYDDYHHHRHHGGDWVGPLIALGIVGAAVAERERVRPAPIYYYDPPQAYVTPPPAPREVWYYCRSANQYYPYTAYCPEGWQSVPARPRW